LEGRTHCERRRREQEKRAAKPPDGASREAESGACAQCGRAARSDGGVCRGEIGCGEIESRCVRVFAKRTPREGAWRSSPPCPFLGVRRGFLNAGNSAARRKTPRKPRLRNRRAKASLIGTLSVTRENCAACPKYLCDKIYASFIVAFS